MTEISDFKTSRRVPLIFLRLFTLEKSVNDTTSPIKFLYCLLLNNLLSNPGEDTSKLPNSEKLIQIENDSQFLYLFFHNHLNLHLE